MQLLSSLPNQFATPSNHRVLNVLHDIASNIQLQSNFWIGHPAYKPLELPDAAVVYFQRLPEELQHRFWRSRLQGFLYGIYYNGSLRSKLAIDPNSVGLEPQQNLENNSFQGVDLQFYDRLHENNWGEGRFESGWQVLRQESNGSLAVLRDGLTLYLEPERHLPPDQRSVLVGDVVSIRLPKNRVQSGFYLAIGNATSPASVDPNSQTVRIYFNISPEGAVLLMGGITQHLNAAKISFQFKALYNPADYDRYDAAVLYIQKQDYETVRLLLQNLYAEAQAHFGEETPLFTKFLAPGLGLAEEPNQKFAAQEKESFGTHRCRIVANGLLEAWQTGEDSPEQRMQSILNHFSYLGIDLSYPYLNANSEEIYTPLTLC